VKVEIKTVKLSQIKLNPDNPRRIGNVDMARLVKSLTDFPDMLNIREIVVDETMTVLGGNMRLLALRKIRAKEATAKIVKGLTEAQKREFIIKDNATFGDWDFDLLANSWADLSLKEWGITMPEINAADDLVDLIVTEKEWKAANKTTEAAIEALSAKIKKITEDHPREINSAMAVIVNNGSGNAVLFLVDPNTSDIVKELKRLADAGEHSPLETLVRSLL